jgi:hypothetical protein
VPEIRKTPALEKKRVAARQRVLFGGKIVHDDGAFSIDCTIRDLSASGAKITLGQRVSIPNEVWFIDLHGGVAYAAEVAWRRTPYAGLRFLRRVDLASAPKELAYLVRLWKASIFRK